MEKRAIVRTEKSVCTEHCYYSTARTYEKLLLFTVQIIMNLELITGGKNDSNETKI
jgi:hypothetical protein